MVCANHGEQPIPFNHVKDDTFAWFYQKHTYGSLIFTSVNPVCMFRRYTPVSAELLI